VDDLDEEQHIDPLEEHGVHGEDRRPGSCGPERSGTVSTWARTAGVPVDAGLVEDLPHGAGRHSVAQADEFSLDATVAPRRVLRGQALGPRQSRDRCPA
jgi:hypothetical protein